MKDYLRKCKTCGLEAKNKGDLDLFVKHKKQKYGRVHHCKKCRNEYQNKKRGFNGDRNPAGTFKNPMERRRYYKYGLLPHEYNNLVDTQGNKCKICQCLPSSKRNRGHNSLAVDHDHSNGEVRGLLCASCNTSIGALNDDIKLFKKCIEYLSS